MEFLKKHYEKVILGVVLVALAVAAFWLSMRVKAKQDDLKNKIVEMTNPQQPPVPTVDIQKQQAVIERIKNPPALELTISNHVFNPVQWVKMPPPEEKVMPLKTGSEWGVRALQVTGLTPLLLTVTLDNVTGQNEKLTYFFTIKNETILDQRLRSQRTSITPSVSSKNSLVKILEANAPGDKNDAVLKIELTGEPEPVVVSKSKPFVRTNGWMVDMKYPLENLTFAKQRKASLISFAGDTYNLIAITEKEVVLSANSNQKKYTIPVKLAP